MFSGSMAAIVTPFRRQAIDEEKLRELIEFQIRRGTSALVPCGTTGESATLSHEEHNQVILISVETARKRVPIIAGTGSNSTDEAIRLTRKAQDAGADAALLITPYYNKPTQEGLYQHYRAVAEAVDIPIILYNVPGRTSVNLLPQTVERLARIKNIAGIKEASGSLAQVTEILQRCGDNITVLSGDDALALPIIAVGGKGVISVAANIIPDRMAELVDLCLRNDWARARALNVTLYPLFQALFYETNPIPVKTALSLMGMIREDFRLPLCGMSEWNLNKLKEVLVNYQLLPDQE
jgi:4-hydroxy-tetrahydrodipicolinate synthase